MFIYAVQRKMKSIASDFAERDTKAKRKQMQSTEALRRQKWKTKLIFLGFSLNYLHWIVRQIDITTLFVCSGGAAKAYKSKKLGGRRFCFFLPFVWPHALSTNDKKKQP